MQPPSVVVAEAQTYAEQLRAVDDVAEVSLVVGGLDPEHPEVWVSYVLVEATEAESLADLPERVQDVTAPSSSRLDLRLRFPATDDLALVILRPALGLEAPAATLRSLAFAERVILDGVTTSVILREGFDFEASTTLLREGTAGAAFGSLRLSRGDTGSSIVVTTTTPSVGLLGLLDSVALDPSVEHLRMNLVNDATRGSLIIDTSDPAGVAAKLDVFIPSAGDIPIHYEVRSNDGKIDGCVGRVPC